MLKSNARKIGRALKISVSPWMTAIIDAERLIAKHRRLIEQLKISIKSLRELHDQNVALPRKKGRGRPAGRTNALPNKKN